MALNILVVEDSVTQARRIQMILEDEGHNVFLSSDGTGLLEQLIKNEIHIMLLDIVLPGLDGFELLKQVLDCGQTSDVLTIMVTGLTSANDLKHALDLGALDYVKKPVDNIELIARLNSAIRLKSKQDLLKEFAVRDKLTNLYNRLYFDETLAKLIHDIDIIESGLCLAMVDCDFFKKVNDTYGHVAGDKVLSSLGNAISKSVKGKDIVCRYGGEEFCVILMNSTLRQGFAVSERIRQNVQKMKITYNETEIMVTISMGLTHLSSDEKVTAQELLEAADKALYMAKSCGRNRVEVAYAGQN